MFFDIIFFTILYSVLLCRKEKTHTQSIRFVVYVVKVVVPKGVVFIPLFDQRRRDTHIMSSSKETTTTSGKNIVRPLENGAVVLAGELDGSAVDALLFDHHHHQGGDDTPGKEARIKSWLYLNRDDDDETKRKVVEARVRFKSIPIDGTSLKDAERLKTTLSTYMKEEFERPGVIQCSTATRAGIPYILHLAETLNLTFETAMNVAKDMELNVVTRENLVQFLKRSIKEKGGGGGKRSGGRNDDDDDVVVFRQLFERESSTYTYLLGCAETRECLLIDPVLETVERDLQVIDDLGLTLKLCVNTHCHADHITGSGEIKKLREGVKSVISKRAGAMADVLIDEGDVVEVGTSVKLKCLSTPGHTSGCVSLVLGDNTDVFTGDALLIRGCGRTDFQGGSSETLFDGVTRKLLGGLPDACKVWPAHDYKGRMMSTIGEEKRLNPRLGAGKTKEEFVQIMKDLNLPYPKKIDASLPRNLKCGAEE